jgi:hypothetical protein
MVCVKYETNIKPSQKDQDPSTKWPGKIRSAPTRAFENQMRRPNLMSYSPNSMTNTHSNKYKSLVVFLVSLVFGLMLDVQDSHAQLSKLEKKIVRNVDNYNTTAIKLWEEVVT